MIKMTLQQAASILELKETTVNKEFQGISIDTRTLQPGNLFCAIPGTRVDGHNFIEDARIKGAACALVMRKVESALPQLEVKDNINALGKLSAAWRDNFKIPFIAATGSSGKTTLKNMIAAILTAACHGDDTHVLASHGTYNNHLGLPLTLVRLNAKHRFATVEMGMNHFGEIEYLTKLAKPNVAIITNAAAAHLEGVGDVAGVARAKSEIFLGMPANGIAILNRDDAYFTFWREQLGHRRFLTFGFHLDANVCVQPTESYSQKTIIKTPQGKIEINLPLLGKHNILNALAACAATFAINIDLASIKAGLEKTKPAPGRLQLYSLANDIQIIDDTYNANPLSLHAAIETLAAFAGKKILVLGDMNELGREATSMHQFAGKKIKQAGIDFLFTYGELSAAASIAFGADGYHFNDQAKLIDALKSFLHGQVTFLIKGSRSLNMEKIVSALLEGQTFKA